jgi:hypothetical protein
LFNDWVALWGEELLNRDASGQTVRWRLHYGQDTQFTWLLLCLSPNASSESPSAESGESMPEWSPNLFASEGNSQLKKTYFIRFHGYQQADGSHQHRSSISPFDKPHPGTIAVEQVFTSEDDMLLTVKRRLPANTNVRSVLKRIRSPNGLHCVLELTDFEAESVGWITG